MAFDAYKQSILQAYSGNIHIVLRLGGMSVAIGRRMDFELAKRMLQ